MVCRHVGCRSSLLGIVARQEVKFIHEFWRTFFEPRWKTSSEEEGRMHRKWAKSLVEVVLSQVLDVLAPSSTAKLWLCLCCILAMA